jgi:outer membrane lipoprotein-sorting protein
MKKYIFIILCLLLIGCKNNDKDVIKNIKKKNDNLDSYNIGGELNIYNGDDKYTYDVDVKYKKDGLYRVSLVNKVNNHEQIILRNEEGVYVLTPSLNKSFKFQSDWPYNNSQVYILARILSDIDSDEDKKYEYKDNMHIFTTKVEYSTNSDLVKQNIYFDNNYILKKVEVFNDNNEVLMDFNLTNFDDNCKLDDDIFILDKNVNEDTKDVSNTLDGVIYPMYLPSNTYLTSESKMNKENGERVILTFGGDKPFTLIEETISVSKELELDYTPGEPGIIIDTVGSIDESNINWLSNGIEYSVVSDTLDKDELLSVAKSISAASITK